MGVVPASRNLSERCGSCKQEPFCRLCWLIPTSARRLRLVPLGVLGVHALDGDGALLQGIAGLAGKLHHSSQCPRGVAAGQVAVLDEGLVAVTGGEGCGSKTSFDHRANGATKPRFVRLSLSNLHQLTRKEAAFMETKARRRSVMVMVRKNAAL